MIKINGVNTTRKLISLRKSGRTDKQWIVLYREAMRELDKIRKLRNKVKINYAKATNIK
jgi:hypothetical protein